MPEENTSKTDKKTSNDARNKEIANRIDDFRKKLSGATSNQYNKIKIFSLNVKDKIGSVKLPKMPFLKNDTKAVPILPKENAAENKGSTTANLPFDAVTSYSPDNVPADNLSPDVVTSSSTDNFPAANITTPASIGNILASDNTPADIPSVPAEQDSGKSSQPDSATNSEDNLQSAEKIKHENEILQSSLEIEKLNEQKKMLEQEINTCKVEQKKERETITRIKTAIEESIIQKQVKAENELQEKIGAIRQHESHLEAVKKKRDEEQLKKEQIENEIKKLLEKKKIEELMLEEIKKIRKEQEKGLGFKRFFIKSQIQKEQSEIEKQKKLDEAKKRDEEVKKNKLGLENKKKLEADNKRKLEEDKKKKESAEKAKQEEIKKKEEAEKKKNLDEKLKEGIRLGFLHIKTRELTEDEMIEKEKTKAMEEDKSEEVIRKYAKELEAIPQNLFFNDKEEPKKQMQAKKKAEIFTNLSKPEEKPAPKQNENGYVIRKANKGKEKDEYTIRVVKKGDDNITIVNNLKGKG